MNYAEILTVRNIATIIAFATIAIALQYIFQILLKKIFEFISQDTKGKEVVEGKKSKRVFKILKLITLLINLSLFLYVVYIVVFTSDRNLPPWFLTIIVRYGRLILLAVVMFVIYKLGIKIIAKGINTLLYKTAIAENAKNRAHLREKTLVQILSYFLLVTLSIFFIYELLISVGFDLKAVLATAGIAGFGIGFGAQNLIRDYINGFFIILEDRFAVGDVISINGMSGFVEKLTLRITSLRNTSGTLITIPNSEINSVQNMTKDWSRVDFAIGVDYSTDVKKALKTMLEELEALKKQMPDDLIEPIGQRPDVLALDSFGDSSLNLRVWFKTKPLRQWAVQRAYNERILERFNREGIVIPFPQSTLSMREEMSSSLAHLITKGK